MRQYEVVDAFTVIMEKTGRPASYTRGAVFTFTHAVEGRIYFKDPYGDVCYTEDDLTRLEDVGSIKRMGVYVRSDRRHGVQAGGKPRVRSKKRYGRRY